MSTVYLLSYIIKEFKAEYSPVARLRELMYRAGIRDVISEGDTVAIKTHFGSPGGFRIVRPIFLKKIVEVVKELGGKPFVTDTCRPPALDYLEIANAEGINHLSVGAPVIIADGLKGNDYRLMKINGEVLKEVEVASAIYEADAMIVVSHVKGHRMAGFGGALKNLAMGCTAKPGKRRIHDVLGGEPPVWREEKCTRCGACVSACDHKAIALVDGKIVIDEEKCVRCYRCVWVCPNRALVWDRRGVERFLKAIAEAAAAVVNTFKEGKILYLNFVCDVTVACDCTPWSTNPLVPDIGILSSKDAVAIDTASLDLINKAEGIPGQTLPGKVEVLPANVNKFLEVHGIDPYIQVCHGEKIGLGSTKYKIVEI